MNIMRIAWDVTNFPNRCLVVEKLNPTGPTDESVRDHNPVRFISQLSELSEMGPLELHQGAAHWSFHGPSVARLRVLLSKAWHGTGYGHDLRAAPSGGWIDAWYSDL